MERIRLTPSSLIKQTREKSLSARLGLASMTLAAAMVAMGAPAVHAGPAAAKKNPPVHAANVKRDLTHYGYIVNYGSSDLTVINTKTNSTVTTISRVGFWPLFAAASPDNKYLYVTIYGDCQSYTNGNPACVLGTDFTNSHVAVVDTATNTVVNNFVAGYGPAGVAVVKTGSAAGNVFVANFGANSGPTSPYSGVPGTVSIYNPTTGVVQSLTVGLGSAGVAISNDGLWAYVTNSFESTISVINTSTNTVVNTVPVAAGTLDLAISPLNNDVYVTSPIGNTVSVFTEEQLLQTSPTPLSTFSIPDQNGVPVTTWGIAFGELGLAAYVSSNDASANGYLSTIDTLDPLNNKVLKTASTANANNAIGARSVSVTLENVYVANFGLETVPTFLEGSNCTGTVGGPNIGNVAVFNRLGNLSTSVCGDQGPSYVALATVVGDDK